MAAEHDRYLRWTPMLLSSEPFSAGDWPAEVKFRRRQIPPTAWLHPDRIEGSGETVTLSGLLSAMLGSAEAARAVVEQVQARPQGTWIDLELPLDGASSAGSVPISAFHRVQEAGKDLQVLNAWYGQRLPNLEEEASRLREEIERARHVLAQQEGALRLERARTEALLEANPAPVAIHDLGYRVVAQNQAHRRLFGDRRGQLCHQAYHGRAEPCPVCPMGEALASRQPAEAEDRPGSGPLAGSRVLLRLLPLFAPDHSGAGVIETLPAPPTASAERQVEVLSTDLTLRDRELRLMEEALRRAGGNRAQAARLLGISRATLWRRLGPQQGRPTRPGE
jgi:PAS domain-containing protein